MVLCGKGCENVGGETAKEVIPELQRRSLLGPVMGPFLENLMAEIHGISNSRADMRSILARLDKQAGKEVSGIAVFWEGENGVEFETAGEMTLSRLVGSQLAVTAACLETLLSGLEISEEEG